MKGFVPPDPETKVSQEHCAVVYVPRKGRNRFAAASVEIMESEEMAMEHADPKNKRFAARVIGPSKSSEGQFIYYLSQWLE